MNQILENQTSSAGAGGEASEAMEHNEAVEMMASERYLLNELSPELRDAYEEHLFGCTECANDLKLGAAFVDHAKTVLATMEPEKPAVIEKPKPTKRDWFAWLRPAVMVPVFASLLAIIAYQNLRVFPALELAASEPRVLPAPTVLEGATRSGRSVVQADLLLGSTVTVPLPQNVNYASYKFEFYNSKNKLIWTHTVRSGGNLDDTVTLWLPGRIKQDSYKLAISGITSTGEDIPISSQFFDLQVKK